ncbi:hypothetical protein GXP67_31935 [Rhodocytophaga rosea]|uniref:Uncharacterized protein n=1 Tax=Rhodocytophaga rosea TaxID=2704465 RepID=A0A6C0GUB0_9BACT|nr:hypothetical protein [Rhodocytophaga rosea]QHT70932.1 hypothetical protein GXP67_31935 [Rhodocytophaga rosea]
MAVVYQDVISLPLSESDILQAIQRAKQSNLMDNLRMRHPNIGFDCKVRGFIGEIALKNWFASHQVFFNQVNYLPDGTCMDIDFVYGLGTQALHLEVKTSLIPDEWRTLPACIQKGDIKLIRRGKQTIEQMGGDIHLQIYFRQRRKAKDRWLSQQAVDLHHWSEKQLYDALLGRAYLDNIFLVAWIDKSTLVSKLSPFPLSNSTWQFPGLARKFWRCSIVGSHKPAELIQYLKAQSTRVNNLNFHAA